MYRILENGDTINVFLYDILLGYTSEKMFADIAVVSDYMNPNDLNTV